jgi:hypothetical protein
MTSRRINLDTPIIPDPQVMAWMEANGIDPHNVPAAQEVLVKDGQITFVEFVRNEDGIMILRDEVHGFEKVLRTVPLISALEDHNL